MGTTSLVNPFQSVPQPIVNKLDAAIRRARLVVMVRGLLAVVTIAIITLLVGMGVDAALTIFSTVGRVLLSLALLGVIVAAVIWYLVRPFRRAFSLKGIARLIEQNHPELQERLSSSVELLMTTDAPELRGSQVMISQLTHEAIGQVDIVHPDEEFSFRPLRRLFIVAGIVSSILLLLFALWPSQASILASRLVAPLGNFANIRAADLVVVPGKDVLVAEGDSLRIEVTSLSDRVGAARVRSVSRGGTTVIHQMTPMENDVSENPRFVQTLTSLQEDLEYRIEAVDALTSYYRVTVVPKPIVETIDVHYDYPAYIEQEAENEFGTSGQIKAPLGTTVTVTATLNKEVPVAKVLLDGAVASDVTIEQKGGQSVCTWRVVVGNEMVGGRQWELRLEDEHGFANVPQQYSIKAARDLAPKVQIDEPTENQLTLNSSDTLPVEFAVEDDHGISNLVMAIRLDGEKHPPQELNPLLGDTLNMWHATAELRLATLPLKGIKLIEIQLVASDNLPKELGGPQHGMSRVVTIKVDDAAVSYFERKAAETYEQIRAAMLAVLLELKHSKERSENLPQIVDNAGSLGEATVLRIDEMRDHLGNAETGLIDLGDLIIDGIYQKLAYDVADLATTDVKRALDHAGRIQLSDTARDRVRESRSADQHIDESIQRLEAMLTKLDELAKKSKTVAGLKKLQGQQEQLETQVRRAGDDKMPADVAIVLEGIQEQIKKEISEHVEESVQANAKAVNDYIEHVSELAKDAKEAAERQKTLAEISDKELQPISDKELKKEVLAMLADKQEKIARKVAALKDEIKKSDNPKLDSILPEETDIAKKPNEVLDAIKADDIPKAIKDAEDASKELQQVEAKLNEAEKQNPRETDQNANDPKKLGQPPIPDLKRQADDLARQQATVAKQLDDVKKGNIPKLLEEEQKAVAKLAKELEKKAAANQARTEALDQPKPAQKAAEEARQALKKAAELTDAAARAEAIANMNRLAALLSKLEEEQRELREETEVRADGSQDVSPHVVPQQDIMDRTLPIVQIPEAEAFVIQEALGKAFFGMEDAVRALKENNAAEAEPAQIKAEEGLAEARRAAEMAAGAMAAADPQPPSPKADQGDEKAKSQGQADGEEKAKDGKGKDGKGKDGKGKGEPSAGQPQPSQPVGQTQRDAVASLENAAKALEGLHERLTQQAEQPMSNPQDPVAPELAVANKPLSEALQAAEQAEAALQSLGEGQETPSGAESQPSPAESAAEASDALAKAAEAVAAEAGLPSESSPEKSEGEVEGEGKGKGGKGKGGKGKGGKGKGGKGKDGKGGRKTGGSTKNNQKDKLKEYGLELDDWEGLPGNLKDKILQAEAENVSEEYRDLVRSYFRELAQRGIDKTTRGTP